MSKKLSIIISIILIITLMTGCGSKGNEKNNSSNNSNQQSENNNQNSNSNSGNSSGSITLNTGEDMKWPSNLMGNLPNIKASVTGIISDNANKACTVTYEKMEFNDAKEYLAKLEAMGYKDGLNLNEKDLLMFTGVSDDKSGVTFTYNVEEKNGFVYYIVEEKK